MMPFDPRSALYEFLEFMDQNAVAIQEDPENFQRLMDWLAVEALESAELSKEIRLLLTLQTEIEADCLQAYVDQTAETKEIPAYRRPALETLLAKWRQNLNRTGTGQPSLRSMAEEPERRATGLFPEKFDLHFFGERILCSQPMASFVGRPGVLRARTSQDKTEPTEISYQGPGLSIRTVISEMRKAFGEYFPTMPKDAQVYKILQEFRTRLPGSTSRSMISEDMANEICLHLGWHVVFRAR